jgi:outer membrane murein-binding lipoprotein Lpp
MLYNCSSLQSLPAGMTLGAVTNASSMLYGCSSLQSLPAGMTLGAVTNASSMLYNCSSLQSLPAGMTLGAVTNASSMLYGCASLQSLPAGMTLAACTTTTSAFSGCTSLQAADGMAIPESFSIASCNFDAAALDALYTALPTVTGKTLTVTGNPGTSGDTPSIATAKGWTVAGS